MYHQPPARRLSTQSTHSALYSPHTSPPSATAFPQHNLIPVPCRQLHPPKSPLYRPAVLRAIDHISSAHPSAGSSLLSTSPKSVTSADLFGDFKREAAYGDDFEDAIGDDVCEEEDDAGNVTGPPRRQHWKPDAEATICDSPACIKQFSFYVRRHHCRRCGNVFCSQHAYHFLPLNQNGRVHPQGVSSRVCDTCYGDYRRIRAVRRTGSMSSSSTSSTISGSPPSSIGMGIKPIPRRMDDVAGLAGKVGSYVGSVPRDWSWSTF